MRAQHVRMAGAAVALIVFMGLGAAAPAFADTADDLITADQELSDAADAFLTVVNDSSTSFDEVQDAADEFVTEAQPIADEFRSIASSATDSSVQGFANDFGSEVDDMIAAADDMSDAIDAQDETAFETAIDDYNTASDAYSSTVDDYNEYIDEHPPATDPLSSGDPGYVIWLVLLIVAVVFLIAAVLMMVLLRNHHGALPPKTQRNGTARQTTLKGLRRNMVIGAAIFVVGAAIPFVQYWFVVKPGETYYIFWYPLVVGGILLLISVGQYMWASIRIARDGSAPEIAHGAITPPPAA